MANPRTKKPASPKPEDELDDYSDFGIGDDEELEDEIPEGYEDDEEEAEYDDYDTEGRLDRRGGRVSRNTEEDEEDELPEGHDHDLDFDEIAGATDLDEEKIYIEAWKGNVYIRSITKREFDHMRRVSRSPKNKTRSNDILERELLMAGLVKPMIPSVDKYNMLMERSAGPMVHILNAIYRKSGLEKEAERERERRFPKK